jgi:ABC-type lipoprotein release transport system permease subunit
VNPNAFKVGTYRFRATIRSRWTSYLALVLFIALLGGVAMGTVAGARRTETSFATLLDNRNSSQIFGAIQVYNPQAGYDTGYSASAVQKVRRLRHVAGVVSLVGLNAVPVGPHGQSIPGDSGFSPNGSVDGLDLTQDRLFVTKGRLPNPHRADEFVADSGTVRQFGWHLGETVTFGYYTNKAGVAAGLSGPKIEGTFKARLVGTGAIQAQDLVQDQVDNTQDTIILFTPALTRQFLTCCANDTFVAMKLKDGNRYDTQVQKEYEHLFPKIGIPPQTELSIEHLVNDAISPEALALGIFGLLTALAALAIAAQLIGRIVRSSSNDSRILRAMGADPRTTLVDGFLGAIVAVATGSILAVGVAIALSPLAPIGPIRPYLGAHFNVYWTVLGPGLALFLVALGAITANFAYRNQPHRARKLARRPSQGNFDPKRVAGKSGLPIAAVTGVGFALETGGGQRTVPMRSAILGAAIALIIVGATTTFASSLRTLVSTPSLYGWDWSAALNGGGGVGDLPKAIYAPLARDPDIKTTSDAYFATLRIDGKPVPVMGENPGAKIQPPMLSGHDLRAAGQVVLGTATLEMLHKSIGETVVVSSGRSKPTTLQIVGTATMPAYGQSGSSHLEMGVGAVLNYTLIPLFERDIFDLPPGPNAILIRYRPGVTLAQGGKSLQRAVDEAGGGGGNSPGNLYNSVERPAQIVDYRSLGNTPIELGAILSGGALVALGLILLSSVRRRRRDIALLKALGFSRRQVIATIAVQSTIAVGLGALVGLPLGILVGRTLWDLFANSIHAVPRVVVPTGTLLIIAAVALVMANVIAALPARIAARTSPAILLRAE